LALPFYGITQGFQLLFCEVILQIFRIDIKQKQAFLGCDPVVNDTCTTAFSASTASPTQLPQATTSCDDWPSIRSGYQERLQFSKIFAREQTRSIFGEDGGLDKFHYSVYTSLAYICQALGWISQHFHDNALKISYAGQYGFVAIRIIA